MGFWNDFSKGATDNMGEGARMGAEAAKMKLQAKLEEDRDVRKENREDARETMKAYKELSRQAKTNEAVFAARGPQELARFQSLDMNLKGAKDIELIKSSMKSKEAVEKQAAAAAMATPASSILARLEKSPDFALPNSTFPNLPMMRGSTSPMSAQASLEGRLSPQDPIAAEQQEKVGRITEIMRDKGLSEFDAKVLAERESAELMSMQNTAMAEKTKNLEGAWADRDEEIKKMLMGYGSGLPETGVFGGAINAIGGDEPETSMAPIRREKEITPADMRLMKRFKALQDAGSLTPANLKNLLKSEQLTNYNIRALSEQLGKTPREILSMAGLSEDDVKYVEEQDVTFTPLGPLAPNWKFGKMSNQSYKQAKGEAVVKGKKK